MNRSLSLNKSKKRPVVLKNYAMIAFNVGADDKHVRLESALLYFSLSMFTLHELRSLYLNKSKKIKNKDWG